jgi:hypothetical protein
MRRKLSLSLVTSRRGSQSNGGAAAGGVLWRIAGARPPVAPAPAGFIILSRSRRALTRRMRLLPETLSRSRRVCGAKSGIVLLCCHSKGLRCGRGGSRRVWVTRLRAHSLPSYSGTRSISQSSFLIRSSLWTRREQIVYIARVGTTSCVSFCLVKNSTALHTGERMEHTDSDGMISTLGLAENPGLLPCRESLQSLMYLRNA